MTHRFASPRNLDDLLLYRLTRLVSVAGASVVRMCEGEYGITRREWRLIAALADTGPMQPSTLAERIQLDRGRTSKAISLMLEKGLVTRSERLQDRRLVDIELTQAGRSIYESLFPLVAGLNRALVADFSEHELSVLDDLLGRLLNASERCYSTQQLPKADRKHGGGSARLGRKLATLPPPEKGN